MPYVDRMQKLRDIFKNASIKYTGKSYVVLIGEGLSAKDSMAKEYFADNDRFADLCNL